MIRRSSARWRGGQVALVVIAVAGVVVVGLVVRGTGNGGSTDVGATRPPRPVPSESASPSPSESYGALQPLPSGLDDRDWIAEAGARWIAGSLGGRIVVLPKDEIGIGAGEGLAVSVRYNNGGATSAVMIRDISNGKLRLSVDRPGTVNSAVVSGGTVYISGDTSLTGPADAGVQAVSLVDGKVSDLIAPGTAPADATGFVTRSQLRISPAGDVLGSGLCEAERCWIDRIDLATGARTTPVRAWNGFLTALSQDTLYTVNDTSTSLWALDARTGSAQWSLEDGEIGGMYPTSDGTRLIVGYSPNNSGGAPTFTVSSADARSGAIQRLLERSTDTGIYNLYGDLSNDRYAVIGPGATLGDGLAGVRARLALTLLDVRSGAALADAVTLVAP
jgi:hypothetical protein